MSNRVHILDEVKEPFPGGEALCFQRVVYLYQGVESLDPGFRFIWRNAKKGLKAQRGQACIDSLDLAEDLIGRMRVQLGVKRSIGKAS